MLDTIYLNLSDLPNIKFGKYEPERIYKKYYLDVHFRKDAIHGIHFTILYRKYLEWLKKNQIIDIYTEELKDRFSRLFNEFDIVIEKTDTIAVEELVKIILYQTGGHLYLKPPYYNEVSIDLIKEINCILSNITGYKINND